MNNIKEVYFDEYCRECKYKNLEEHEEPCCDCLSIGGREDSHKPEYYEGDK